jgi:phage shock protein PspC (stress-responsive transcriptional regulator)
MKNSKLLIAFLLGVGLMLLLDKAVIPRLPNFPSFPNFNSYIDDGFLSAPILIALILLVAYASQRFGAVASETAPKPISRFWDFLKNLRTSESDQWLGGVCGGLGRSTPVPSWVWRLCFALAFFCYGSGLVAYVFLWIFVPGEKSADTQTEPIGTAPKSFLEFLRHLKRSSADSWVGGVCGGLSRSTPVPAWIWRLGFALLIFYYGSGLLIYLLLWIFLPRDETTNQVAA